MAESAFLGGLMTLREIGFFDFFLPFLLFFAIVYGALEKTKVFGDNRHDINAVIALVIGLIAATTAWVIQGLMGFLPWVAFIAVILVCFLMLVAMVFGDVESLAKNPFIKGGAVIFIVVAIALVAFYALGFNEMTAGVGSGISETDIALIIMTIVGIIITALIIKGGSSSSKSS